MLPATPPPQSECSHNQAVWLPAEFGCWKYSCSCGLEAFGLTLPAAKTLFGIRAEKIRVGAIQAKRERGEELTEQEMTVEAYSPFGSAAGCSARGYFLGSR